MDEKQSAGEYEKVIFFGNGPLAEAALEVLKERFEVIFHARSREDLEQAKALKRLHPEAHGILASYGVLIKPDVLDLFEPEGILNIHPSLLPRYRGASPIESAILAGDSEFGVSVMKLVRAMDAGPVYYQGSFAGLPLDKAAIYRKLARAGAEWICENITHLPEPAPQDEAEATYTSKLDKSMSWLTPEVDTAEVTHRKIVAYQGFPKPKYTFYGIPCIVLAAHIAEVGDTARRAQNGASGAKNGLGETWGEASKTGIHSTLLTIPCADGRVVAVDRLQPEGRRPMDAKSFLNGYRK